MLFVYQYKDTKCPGDGKVIHHQTFAQMSKKSFPMGIFPPRLRSILEEVSEDRQFPLDYLSASVLWLMSVLVGACAYLRTTLGKTYANIYLMLVGLQGANKSAPLAWATEYLHHLDYEALVNYEKDMAQYEAAIQRGEREEKPTARRFFVDASTPEAVIKVLRENPRGIGQCADEIAKAFKDMGRYSRHSDEELYLRLFNGQTMTVDRATRQDVLHVSRPYFCMVGTIQPQTFNRIFTKDRVENGLLARFIEVVHFDEHALLWNLEEDLPSDADQRYEAILDQMIDWREQIDPAKAISYSLAPEAAETIQDWQNAHEVHIDSFGRDIDRAIFRKLQLYVLKFALIIQLMWDLLSDDAKTEHVVDLPSAALATSLADYFYGGAKDLARSVSQRKLSEREQKLLEALPQQFSAEEGLEIAKRYCIGKTCFYDFLAKTRGILIDQPSRGTYSKRF